MLSFRSVEITDKDSIQPFFDRAQFQGSEYCFGNFYCWKKIYDHKWAVQDGFLFLQSAFETPSFLYPLGEGDIEKALHSLLKYTHEQGFPLMFHSVPAVKKDELEKLMPGLFHVEEQRDFFDYIYNAEDLMSLKGKKLHAKRNFVNRFMLQNPDWSFEELTADNMDECRRMSAAWCAENDCLHDLEKNSEMCAVRRALDHFDELGYVGGLLRAGGEVVAFSFGEKLTDDTMIVHVEKAMSKASGAYQMINREFAKRFAGGYRYISREDDAGVEGLRKAKLSYQPAYLWTKYKCSYHG